MKRLIAILSLCVAGAVGLFAQTFDVNYYYMSKQTLTLKDEDSVTADFDRTDVPFGLDFNVDIPFNEGTFQVGFNVDIGLDFGGKYEMAAWGEQENAFLASYFFSGGLVFKLNLGEHSAIAFRPGVQYTQVLGSGDMYVYGENTDVYIGYDAKFLSLSINVGYTLWCTDSFGLNVGIDWDKPLAGMYKLENKDNTSEYYYFDIAGDSSFRVYFGLSFGKHKTGAYSMPAGSTSTAYTTESATEEKHETTVAAPAPAAATPSATAPASESPAAVEESASGPTQASTSLDTTKVSKSKLSKLYNIKVGSNVRGPYNLETLAQMARTGRFTKRTLVLPAGTTSWVTAGEVKDLEVLFTK